MKLRDPKVLADLLREAKVMAQHPDNDAIDDWIEAIYDWDDLNDPPPPS